MHMLLLFSKVMVIIKMANFSQPPKAKGYLEPCILEERKYEAVHSSETRKTFSRDISNSATVNFDIRTR